MNFEKIKIYFGIISSCVIIFGGLFLIWQKDLLDELYSNFQTSQQIQLENYKRENMDLHQKISDLEKQIEDINNNIVQEQVSGNVININTANQQELEKLPGVGPAKAQDIINYRLNTGGFKTISEIQNIKGIGVKTFEKLSSQISVD